MTNQLSTIPNVRQTVAWADDRNCPTCGYQNPTDAEVCLHCEGALGSNCPMCGYPVPGEDKFCNQCGARLPDRPQSTMAIQQHEQVRQNLRALMPETLVKKITIASDEIFGEHREVTVLYVSLLETFPTPQALDEEDRYFLRDEALRLLVEVIYKYEGTVDKFTRNGLIALFGAPIAHENDSERAVRAALEMAPAIQQWQAHRRPVGDLTFQLRIGLNTGPVIAGKVGNDLHMDYTVIGDTANVAAYLESVAEPGAALISLETYQHVQHLFNFESLAPLTLERTPRSLQAFHLVDILKKPRWERRPPGLQTHLIGRSDELGQLEDAVTKMLQDGQRRMAMVTGEAGLGKSRLVAEFRRAIAPLAVKVYQGSCLAYARSAPLWIIAELLRDIMELSEVDSSDQQRAALHHYLQQLNLANAEITPYLIHVLDLEQTDTQTATRLQLLDATMLQRQTHAALRQVLLAQARLEPTVLIFEDLHWLDPASRDFLDYLIHTTDQAHLLLLFVSRSSERRTLLQPLLVAAEKEPERFIDLRLQALSATEGQLLVDQLIKQTSPEASFLKNHIVTRAGGNPFFIEEIIRSLIDRGGLTRAQADGSWQMTAEANKLLKTVPKTVKGLILARFDRLPEGLRHLLQKAAVMGMSFPVSLLHMLSGANVETLTGQLDELEARQFLNTKKFRAEPGYIFRHALLQETIYNTLLKRDRGKIHTKVAQAIEQSTLWLPEEKVEALAYHYAESTHPNSAIPHLITAAENAARRSAYETAVEHYRRVMELLPGPPADPSREFFQVGIGLGCALKFVGEFAAAGQVLSETLQRLWNWSLAVEPASLCPILVESLGQLADIRQREGMFDQALTYLETGLQVLGEAGNQEQTKLRYTLLDRMAWIRFRQGQLEEAFTLASTASAELQATELDDPGKLASLQNTLGGIFWQQGQLDEAISRVERSLQLYEGLGYLWGMAVAYGNLGILCFAQGNWPRAADYYEQAYAMHQVIGNPEGQAVSLDNLGLLRTALGEHQEAQRELEAALAIRQRLGDAWGITHSHVNLADLALTQGRLDEAETHATTALTTSDTIGSFETQIEARWILALVQAAKNELPSGRQLAEQALAMARAAGLMEKEIDCLRVLGVLTTQAGQYLEAEAQLQNSVDLSRKQHDPYRRGQALLALGRLYQHLARTNRSDHGEWQVKALTSLKQASEIFQSLGAAHHLRQTQVALGKIQGV